MQAEGSKFREMVGIETPTTTLLSTLAVTEKPYSIRWFPTLLFTRWHRVRLTSWQVDEVQAMTNETMWYNGCYTMTSYVQNNEKVFTKNPLYWDTDCTLFGHRR